MQDYGLKLLANSTRKNLLIKWRNRLACRYEVGHDGISLNKASTVEAGY